ncbi:MAG: hypothetical protein AB8V03_04775 [Francisella endosymbiont of Hyalomma asiaticum]
MVYCKNLCIKNSYSNNQISNDCCVYFDDSFIVGKLLEILPIGGSSVKLNGYKLILGFIGMFVAGLLVCFGVIGVFYRL